MKKIILSIVAVAALVALPMGVMAQDPVDNASAHASVITDPVVLTEVQKMEFGSFSNTTAGTVKLDLVDGREYTGGVVEAGALGGKSGSYTVTGNPNNTYSILTPVTPVTLTHSTLSAYKMTMSTFTVTAGPYTLDASGDGDFKLGATLTVGANQLGGDYNGAFLVTVAYN